MPVPLRQTALTPFVRIKHDGLAGPDYFNIYGLEYDVDVRGEAEMEPAAAASTDRLARVGEDVSGLARRIRAMAVSSRYESAAS